MRNTLDLSAVPMLHELSHLPVVVDPSHATGIARMVPPMTLAAVAAGCDGLEIEVHNDPKNALSDSAQQLTPEEFEKLSKRISVVRDAVT
jgi:3-deoxy-7-phosphoheptulonate synthase